MRKVLAPTSNFTATTAPASFQGVAAAIRVFKVCALHPEFCPREEVPALAVTRRGLEEVGAGLCKVQPWQVRG